MKNRTIQKLIVIVSMTTLIILLTGCSSDSEYQRNLHTVGVGFEEMAFSGTAAFVYTDTVEPVFLKFIALRYRAKYPDKVEVYFFDERIPESDCKLPIPESVKSHWTAQYKYNKKSNFEELKILKNNS